jgi:hypothetical protein
LGCERQNYPKMPPAKRNSFNKINDLAGWRGFRSRCRVSSPAARMCAMGAVPATSSR